ncbi:MAG TPA: hypothetical protein VF170_10165, partial [Planctomycetaceae bacterium]
MRSLAGLAVACLILGSVASAEVPLPPETKPLDWEGDIASRLVEAADAFLLRELDRSVERRDAAWTPGPDGRDAMLKKHRERLAHVLGVRDQRVPAAIDRITTIDRDSLVASGDGYEVHAVRWPALDGIGGEGLLLTPKGDATADVVVLPDADQTPEKIAGVVPGVPAEAQIARVLAENGCRVL